MRPKQCSGGGTGRRVRLRSVWSDPWGFKSPLEYQNRIFFMSGFDKPGVEVYINKLSLRMIAVQACVKQAYIAQSVEHVLGKDEVIGSSPIVGSIFWI